MHTSRRSTEENEDKVAWVLEIMYLAEELLVLGVFKPD
jgi:hypothetical protein